IARCRATRWRTPPAKAVSMLPRRKSPSMPPRRSCGSGPDNRAWARWFIGGQVRGRVHAIMRAMKTEPSPTPPETFPQAPAHFLLPGPAGMLEVSCAPADAEAGGARRGTAVICHPHPVHGGTMHNKVVTIVERALGELGLDTVRFNFRGVGKSTGSYDEGQGESDDLASVVAWVRGVRADD